MADASRDGPGYFGGRIALAARELDRAERAVVLRQFGRHDHVLRPGALGQPDPPLLPSLGDVRLPRLAQAAQVGVRPADQQDVRRHRVPARQHRQVLRDDRVEQRGHQVAGRDTALLEAVDVRLGEHAALAGDRVHLRPTYGDCTAHRPGASASPRSCR